MLTSAQRADFVLKWVSMQTPIFRRLIEENTCFAGFQVVYNDQYVGIEKVYCKETPFCVHIEVEDAETFEDVFSYEVWFKHHENNWYPSNEEEELEDYPIKHAWFGSLGEVCDIVESLNREDFERAYQLMEDKAKNTN